MTQSDAHKFGLLLMAVLLIGLAPAVQAKKPLAKKKAAHPIHAAKPATQAQPSDSASWKPPAALATQLGPVVTQYGFQIRLPLGYTVVHDEFDRNSSLRQIGWSRDGSGSSFERVLTLLIGPSFQSRTPEEAVSRFQMLGLTPKMNEFTQGDLQSGEINGVPFARMHWNGERKTDPNVHLHGFTYATVTENTLYVFSYEDTEPRSKQTLPLAEAAAETFQVTSRAAQAALPLPDLGTPKRLEPGVLAYEVPITRGRIATKLWIYLPEHPASPKIPGIFIAPAGTRLFHGIGLREGDRLEHLPYVRSGFAVVAYELDGGLGPNPTEDEAANAALVFQDADGGLTDARMAIDYALAKVPQIDPERLYTAGHSSAGTVSLLVAEHDPRIKACIAYAPATDVPATLGAAAVAAMEPTVPGFTAFVQRDSPNTSASSLTCPLFLFQAEDDTVVPYRETLSFAALVSRTNRQVTFAHVPTGNHFHAMTVDGIPDAIHWLQTLPKR